MDWLAQVAKHHKEWLKIAKVYGAADYAEDCVQQAYIKLHQYGSEDKVLTKGEVNKGYVFFAIKCEVMNYHKANPCFVSEDACNMNEIEDAEQNNEEHIERLWLSIDYYISTHYPLYKKVLYRMWRKNYTIREMNELTEVSIPTIINELKKIKSDLNKKFNYEYNETQRAKVKEE